MYLGEIIKAYREKNDMTMGDFATRTGLSKGYISMLEKNLDHRTGKPIIPSMPTILKVAEAMHETFDVIYNKLNDDVIVSLNSDSEIIELDKESAEYLTEVFERPEIKLLIAEAVNLSAEQINELYQISKILGKREER